MNKLVPQFDHFTVWRRNLFHRESRCIWSIDSSSENRTLMNTQGDQIQNIKLCSALMCTRVSSHLVDGWQMLWPRSLVFWLWVLIASGKTAGVAYCTSALLLGFPRLLVRSICPRQKEENRSSFLLHLTEKISYARPEV